MTNEEQALKELEKGGCIVSDYPDREDRFFVGLGSHGGSGSTVKQAMKNCLNCCKIGRFWTMPNGRLATELFKEISEKFLTTEGKPINGK